MHAVVGRWRMDQSQVEGQQEFLKARIVPRVKTASGFVSGYWSRPTAEGIAYSFIVFADEAAARRSRSRCGAIRTTAEQQGWRATSFWSSRSPDGVS
jgi:hypothetical protein